jgi:hypothetical protein
MRKIRSFAVAAAVLVATGFGVWAASTTHGHVAPSINHTIDTHELMMKAKELPTAKFADHTFVFP